MVLDVLPYILEGVRIPFENVFLVGVGHFFLATWIVPDRFFGVMSHLSQSIQN